MHRTTNGREVMVGVLNDPVFGPVISFGAGGTFVEVMEDAAIAIPPINERLARNLINRTKVAKALGEFRNMPAANRTRLSMFCSGIQHGLRAAVAQRDGYQPADPR